VLLQFLKEAGHVDLGEMGAKCVSVGIDLVEVNVNGSAPSWNARNSRHPVSCRIAVVKFATAATLAKVPDVSKFR
jgi:hypothetical protein